jgi:predicted O-methyltransferase YrrM
VSVTVIKGDAHTSEVLQQVSELLNGRKLDFIFIDSEHTPQAACLETETYRQLLKPCGVIGYHDINDIKAYLDTLDQSRVERYIKQPPYSDFGRQNSPGIGIYYAD